MKIAQIAPLHEAVPPRLYGSTERVVAFIERQYGPRTVQLSVHY